MLCVKNYQNRLMFHDVIQKVKAARFSLRHGVYGRLDAGHGS